MEFVKAQTVKFRQVDLEKIEILKDVLGIESTAALLRFLLFDKATEVKRGQSSAGS